MAESSLKDIRVTKLTKATYNRWRIEIHDVLESYRIWDITTGRMSKPDEVISEQGIVMNIKEIDDWKTKDSKARSVIRSTLDDTTFDQVCDCETSADIMKRIKAFFEPKTLNALLELLREFFTYSWKIDDTVGTFVAGLKVIVRKIEALESDDFGNKLNEKLLMAKILGSLPKNFDSFVTSWSILSSEMSLELFIEKLANAERNIEGRSDDIPNEAFKTQLKSTYNKGMKTVGNKFKGKCHKCGKIGHLKRDCKYKAEKSEKFEKTSSQKRTKESKDEEEEKGLSASSAFKIRDEGCIIADSGASVHLTGNIEWFSSLRKITVPLILNIANGKTLQATHVGNIPVEKSINGRKWEKRMWESVYYCESMGNESLFSTTFMEKTKGYGFYHGNGIMRLMKGQKTILGGKRINNQYIPFIRVVQPPASVKVAQSIELWHQRLGHVSDNTIRAMVRNNLVSGLEIILKKRDDCDSCHFGKQTICPHPSREKRECLPGQRFHSDVCHVGVISWNRCKYFMTMKDEASGYRRVYFMKSKEETSRILKEFLLEAEKETGRKAISLRTDNGTEYVNDKVRELLKEMNITHELSPPNVKQCNGMAERENRTLCDTARSLLFNAEISKTDRHLLWTEAIGTAAYLRNRVPSRGNFNSTPYSEWYGKKPDVSHLKVFGAKAFVRIPDSMRHKMDPKAKKTIFVGYDRYTNKVYRVFDLEKKNVERVSDVKIEDVTDTIEKVLFPLPPNEQEEEFEESKNENNMIGTDDEDFTDGEESVIEISTNSKKRGRPLGSKSYQKPVISSDRVLRDRSSKSVRVAAMKVSVDPVSYEDAISRDDSITWKQAMDDEMSSLLKNQTWELKPLPEGQSVVSCRWIFKSKLQPNGMIERCKARLVARGFSQTEGIDYFETFSPVVRYESVRTILAVVAKHDMELAQFDIKTAFLNGSLEEDIYMQQPKGYEDGSNRVCHLKKGLYGLKQASRNWNSRFNNFVKSHGFQQSKADPCVFIKGANTKDWTILSLYVDDGLIACKQKETINNFVSLLISEFEATCHEPTCYVGMEITRNQKMKTLCINQQGYIHRMLQRFGMEDCKPLKSPMCSLVELDKSNEEKSEEKRFPYREAVGCLNYIATITRPDISYVVGILARYGNDPQELHWKAVKRVMKYLKGTINISLCFRKESSDGLVGYCDSDYAGELEERKSTSGYVFLLHDGPIAWSSSLQRVTALSSSEAEYMSMSEALKEILWLRMLMESFGLKQIEPTELKVDNQAAIAMSKNPEFHRRTKHIGVRFHRIRQEQNAGKVNVTYVPSNQQVADLLTKFLPWSTISRCLMQMRMTSLTRGGVENLCLTP